MKKFLIFGLIFGLIFSCSNKSSDNMSPVVVQTDFGLTGSAIGAMYGVMYSVDKDLPIFDLTHFIPPYGIWEGALALEETVEYWPAGTVFVSVVDPGVGTERKSVVLKTKSGHYFVTPDNGTLTFVADTYGVDEVREIDEAVNRRQNTEESYTFHGRDVYVYTGAKLAAGQISFEDVGKSLGTNVTLIPHEKPRFDNGVYKASLAGLDANFGNVWSLLPRKIMSENGVNAGDNIMVKIYKNDNLVFSGAMPIVNTFGDVAEGKNLAYFNSQLNLSFAVNMGSFVADNGLIKYGLDSFGDWKIEVTKLN